jgi:outer membrane protein assembly factor BamA
MPKILTAFLFFAIFAPFAAHASANAQDSTGADSAASDGSSTVINIKNRDAFLAVISWPFVHIIQPTVEFLIYPIIPTLIYISRENLIEKGQNLITYGDRKQILFYPLINAKIGSSSNVGFAYRHEELFLENDVVNLSPHLYINADWDVALNYRKNKISGSSVFTELGARHRALGSNSFRDPETATYYYADSSVFLLLAAGFNVFGNWNLRFSLETHFLRFDLPNLNETIYYEPEVLDRGFYQRFNSFPLTLSFSHNTLDVPYAATRGGKFSVGYSYVPVTSYNSSSGHNYHVLDSRFVHYFLLGDKSYAMTVAESEANRERLKNLTLKEAFEMFNPINVKEEILDRRVLIAQIKARYMIEENKGKAPFIAMGSLGDNFPLRAYSSGTFTAPLVAGISTEYRWPIDRYADALIFNEYGIYGHDFGSLSTSNLRNSYGFGFRIRTPRFFITRFALAFHGLHGVALVFTTRPEYD